MKVHQSLSAWHESLQQPIDGISLGAVKKLCIKAAVLAPSTHNSQPWLIKETEVGITISERAEARLIYSDPQKQYYWISVGAFVQNFVECAHYYGYKVDCVIDGDQVVKLSLRKNEAIEFESLIGQIKRRYSEKRVFTSKPMTNNTLELLGDKNQVFITNDKDIIGRCASVYFEAAKSYRSHANFALELREWMHSSKRKIEGMHHRSSGISHAKALMGRAALKRTPKFLAVMAKKYLKLVGSSSAVGFIVTTGTTPSELLEAGRKLEETALKATKYELSLTPLAAIIEHEQSLKELKHIFGYTGKPQPVIFFRVSDRKEPIHHTARRQYEG